MRIASPLATGFARVSTRITAPAVIVAGDVRSESPSDRAKRWLVTRLPGAASTDDAHSAAKAMASVAAAAKRHPTLKRELLFKMLSPKKSRTAMRANVPRPCLEPGIDARHAAL